MDLAIAKLRRHSASPLHQQVSAHLRATIAQTRNAADAKLPAILDLARHLGVGAKTVQRAYEDLQREGLIASRRKAGTFVVPPEKRGGAPTVFAQDFQNFGEYLPPILAHFKKLRPGVEVRDRAWSSDLVRVDNWNHRSLAGALHPLADLVREEFGELEPSLWTALGGPGPACFFPTSASSQALYYDPELLANLGVPDPRRGWDRNLLLEAAGQLTHPGKKRSGFGFLPDGDDLLTFLWQSGAEVLSPDGRTCLLDRPEALHAARFVRKLARTARVDLVAKDPDFGRPWRLLARRRVAMFLGSMTGAKVFLNAGVLPSRERWAVAPIPTGCRAAGLLQVYGYGLSLHSQRVEEARDLLRAIAQYERFDWRRGGRTHLWLHREFRKDTHHLPVFVEALAHARSPFANLDRNAVPVHADAIRGMLRTAYRQLILGASDPEGIMKHLAAMISSLQQKPDLADESPL